MKQKIIICGAGRVGISITEHLSNEGFDITVIDSNVDAIQKVTELYDVQGVLGLASHPNVLEDAGINDADMIIAVHNLTRLILLLVILQNLYFLLLQ